MTNIVPSIPVVMTEQGPLPQPPATLLAQLIALVSATNPGFTANLPGTLVEDVTSTNVGALTIADQSACDLINSATPYGANQFLLTQLGNIYGVKLGSVTNTSVDVVFATSPPLPGYVLAVGFAVSDGTYTYTLDDGGVTGADGTTEPLSATAVQTGSFAVPPNTVTQVATSVPSIIGLSVNNPIAGVPGLAAGEDPTSFRLRVLQAGLASAQGMPSFLKTLLGNVTGVQQRLISMRQANGGWEIIVGGGDEYQIAEAIYMGASNISDLVGSVLGVIGITNAAPGVVTTDLNHLFATGQIVTITGILGMVNLNGVPLTITVIDQTHFSVGVDTSGYPAYVSGGVVEPNFRNVVVTIDNFPDTYAIPFVIPPQQTVEIVATWNTDQPNFVAAAAIAQLAVPALVAYINSIPVRQPIILYNLEAVFQNAVAPILSATFLTRMVFAVSINGVGVSPEAGTGIISGDPESYFFTTAANVVVVQG